MVPAAPQPRAADPSRRTTRAALLAGAATAFLLFGALPVTAAHMENTINIIGDVPAQHCVNTVSIYTCVGVCAPKWHEGSVMPDAKPTNQGIFIYVSGAAPNKDSGFELGTYHTGYGYDTCPE